MPYVEVIFLLNTLSKYPDKTRGNLKAQIGQKMMSLGFSCDLTDVIDYQDQLPILFSGYIMVK